MDQRSSLQVRPGRQIIALVLVLEAVGALAWWRTTHAPVPHLSWLLVAETALALAAGLALGRVLHRLLAIPAAGRLAAVALDESAEDVPGLTWPWRLGAVGAALGFLAFLEWRQPFYFVQDDNWSQFLPVIVDGGRALFGGVLPVWNPHIFGGVPSVEIGVYALTYPGTYLAYGIARLMGNDLLTLEAFAVLHLAASVPVTQALGSRMGMRPSIATLAALGFALCGFDLMAGRSWYYVLPTALWLPAMILGLVALQRRQGAASFRWLIGMGLAIGLLFHAGNAQFWLYALSLLWVAALALVASRQLATARLADLLCATVLGIGVAAPLLLPQMATLSIDRGGGGCSLKAASLRDMLLPYPLAGHVPHPCEWPSALPQGYAGLGYSGTLTTAAAFLGIALLVAYRTGRRRWGANLWLPAMLLLLVTAFGRSAKLWSLMTLLPVFSRFAHPFKLLFFVEFAIALGGGLVLSRLITALRPPARAWAEAAALVAGASALFLAGVASDEPFFRFNDAPNPYPALPPAIARVLDQPSAAGGKRILPVHSWRDDDRSYAYTMPHNTADVYGRYSLLGYVDGGFENGLPQVARLLAPQVMPAVLPALGVRWALVHDDFFRPGWPEKLDRRFRPPGLPPSLSRDAKVGNGQAGNEPAGNVAQVLMAHATAWIRLHGALRARADGVSLYELPGSAPMAFLGGTDGTAMLGLAPAIDARGVVVRLPAHAAGVLTVNFLALPRMRAYLDGRLAELRGDGWGRITVPVAATTTRVELRYEPNWTPGLLVALVLVIVALGGFALTRRYVSHPDGYPDAASELARK